MAELSDRAARLALASIGVAFAVMAIKFLAWHLSGSVALYSDALESIVNVVAAMVAWWAIRLSRKPPDDNHPFGHHKAEYLSAVVEGVLIVLAAVMIFSEAWAVFRAGHMLDSPGPGMAVNAVAAAINAGWATLLIRAGRAERSPALAADGRHLMTDVVSSVGVLIGLGLVLATGWTVLDPLMACLVGLNVLYEGSRVITSSVGGLMDSVVEPEELARIEAAILGNGDGAIEVHDIRARRAGAATFVEFHLVVDGAMRVDAAHAICDRIETALRAAVPGIRISIHVEPASKRKPDGLEIGGG